MSRQSNRSPCLVIMTSHIMCAKVTTRGEGQEMCDFFLPRMVDHVRGTRLMDRFKFIHYEMKFPARGQHSHGQNATMESLL